MQNYKNLKDKINYYRWLKPRILSYDKFSYKSPNIIFFPINIIFLGLIYFIEKIYEFFFVKFFYLIISKFNFIKNYSDNKLILKYSKKNKSCYILGNGSSLKNINLNEFKSKTTFTVNHFKSLKYPKFNSTFHVMLDGDLFKTTLGLTLKKIKEGKHKKVFIPSNQKDKFRENNSNIQFFDLLPYQIDEYFPGKIRLNNGLPGSLNILPFTIVLAMSLGFEKIYLLGADQDQYLGGKHFISEKQYFKNEPKKIVKFYSKKLERYELSKGISNTYGLWSTFRNLLAHSNIYAYSIKNKIKIYNCSKTGILDIYPYKKLNF
tara:strand:+ start:1787 stop:2743 length:957 start_codon:yes stop_codon:yes gene_type:complete